MKYIARKPFRYGTGVYMTGQSLSIDSPDDIRMLQSQGKIGGAVVEKPAAPVIEKATVSPAENAMQEKAIEEAFEKVSREDYTELSYAEVKELCKARDLPTTGKKAELIERLEGD